MTEMTDHIQRYLQYLAELNALKLKVNGAPVPEGKKWRRIQRLRDLEERLIPKLMAEMREAVQSH